jgi:hypothetical protein
LYFYIRLSWFIFASKTDIAMASLVQYPSELCFSADIPDLVFTTSAHHSTVSVTAGGVSALSETYFPDSSGRIALTDLSRLLTPFAYQTLTSAVVVTITDYDSAGSAVGSAVTVSFTVLYATVDTGTSAASFTASHFLTILLGTKLTAVGRAESLYAYGASQVTLSATMVDASGVVTTATATLAGVGSVVYRFDVSPAAVSAAVALLSGQRLLSYVVTAGSRSQSYRVVTDEVVPAPSLVFTNSFGCQEYIHCVGSHVKDSDYERSSARISGQLRNYRIDETRHFKANTGALNAAMANWADDLFRSTEVYLWADGSVGREVVITDSKSEISNADDAQTAFEFTYSYAQRLHNVLQLSHPGRIFDNTFDYTFN